ncbi:unnamed protein product [Camellia sinensis]
MEVHGPVRELERVAFWEELQHVAFRWGLPWCVGGDFNVVRSPVERSGESPMGRSMRDFAAFIDEMELVDLPLQGGGFTWLGGRASSRLDRFLVTRVWRSIFLRCFNADYIGRLQTIGQF